MNMDNFYGKDVSEVKSTTTSTFRYNNDALVDAETINAYIEELEEAELEKDRLLKALKSLVCTVQKDEINKNHLDVALRKARNVIADIDPTVEKCDCCY